jgi:ferredoxin
MRGRAWRFATGHLAKLIENVAGAGYAVIGPQVAGSAIRWGPIRALDDLPRGAVAETSPGHYRLKSADGAARFRWGASPDSPKRWLHVPEAVLTQVTKDDAGLHSESNGTGDHRYAFVGLRPCDLAAVERLDRVLLEDRFVEPHYAARRREALFIVANCTVSLDTCFCASLDCGPRAARGFDIALTELASGGDSGGEMIYVAEAATERGAELAEAAGAPKADAALLQQGREECRRAAQDQRRAVNWRAGPAVVRRGLEHPRWEETARRCLACGNCTLSCPTCFCVNVVEQSSLDGHTAERRRLWDSCFTQGFTYIHGGSVRTSVKSRYRQWLGHKLAWWQEQFGMPGCTGCGRCIAWCPAGIDITEEYAALAGTSQEGTS